jgi:hypothetical protein
MKIEWDINPLKSKIFLDNKEKEIFRLKIQIDKMLEVTSSAYHSLGGYTKKEPNVENAIKELRSILYNKNSEEEDIRVSDAELEVFIDDLQSKHIGDCTCVAASCVKCHAEDLLGFSTIKGIGKHSLRQIDGAVEKYGNLDDAIIYLENYNPGPRPDTWSKSIDYDKYVPGWVIDAKNAASWLTRYKEDHNL